MCISFKVFKAFSMRSSSQTTSTSFAAFAVSWPWTKLPWPGPVVTGCVGSIAARWFPKGEQNNSQKLELTEVKTGMRGTCGGLRCYASGLSSWLKLNLRSSFSSRSAKAIKLSSTMPRISRSHVNSRGVLKLKLRCSFKQRYCP